MERARGRLGELVKRAGLLVFASHSEEFLRHLCDTALWLEHGRVRAHGELDDILRAYGGHGQ
jgi:ABC-2 type transport system ATP-binding protein